MHVLLFDIDGTLLNTGGAGQAAMEAALAQEFGVDRPVDGIPTAGRTDCGITHDLLAYCGLAADEATWNRFLTAYLSLLPRHLAHNDGIVLPGVPRLLELLTQRTDVALGLLTGNFADGAWTKLRHFSLADHFAFGGFGDRHRHRDDVAREALAVVRQRHPEDSVDGLWVIGDTPADIQCGRAIGARTLAVATGMFPRETLAAHNPDVLRDSLADPHTWLDQLVPPA